MTPENKYLLNTIKSILHGEPMPDLTPDDSGAIDYNIVLQLAKRSAIAGMAAYRICDDETVPEVVRKRFDLERLKITSQQIKQKQVVSELRDIFDANHARGLLLKGSIIRDYYPEPYMRSMGDVDFFMEKPDILRIRSAIIENGFSAGMQGINSHYVFEKYGVVDIEIHSDIEPIKSNYGKDIFAKIFPDATSIQDAMNIWEHTLPFKGSSYMLQLTSEYHYLYVIMHMLRHFISAGTGIRSFIDLWVMNHHYGNTWDRVALNELLDKFGLLSFEQYAVALADRWFELDVSGWSAIEIEEETLDAMEDYILESGTYGRWDNKMMKDMSHDTSQSSKISYVLGRVFKPLSSMQDFYPILNKAPILLPVMWVRRGLHLAIKKKDISMRKLRAVASVDQAQADNLKALFEKLI